MMASDSCRKLTPETSRTAAGVPRGLTALLLDGGRVPRLVDAERCAARERDGRQQAPTSIGDIVDHLDAPAAQRGHRGPDVLAHEVQLGVATLLVRVDRDLGGRESADQ